MFIKIACIFFFLWCHINFVRSNTIQKGNADFASQNCKKIVCEQAHEQAKGLSKLALLDEFVSQTVFLLNDLMKNIDGELEKSANSLLRYVHPHCASTQKILQEVIQKQQSKLTSESPVLGQGIDPMSEDRFEESDQNQSNSFSHNHQFRNEEDGQSFVDRNDDDKYSQNNYDTENVSEEQQFSNYDTSTTVNRRSGTSFVTKDVPKEDKFNRGWNSQKTDWKGIDKNAEENKYKQNNAWKFDSSDQLGTEHKSREGKTIKDETIRRSGNFGGHNICRGVDKGSTFWVPGLDKWCLENCSQGYCPKTHCIC